MNDRVFDHAVADFLVPSPPAASNVVPIGAARRRRGPPDEQRSLLSADPDVVAMLEQLLEKAKAGHIVAIGIASSYADGCTGTGFVSYPADSHGLIVATQVLARRVFDKFHEAE